MTNKEIREQLKNLNAEMKHQIQAAKDEIEFLNQRYANWKPQEA